MNDGVDPMRRPTGLRGARAAARDGSGAGDTDAMPGAAVAELMHQVIESALDAVVAMDMDGRITEWNPCAEGMFGWSRAEAVGRLLADTIIPPVHREAHQRGLERFLHTEHARRVNRHVETEAVRRDGQIFPVELSITPLACRGGGWVFSAFLRDISRRKQIEQELRLAASVFDNSMHGILITDAQGTILRVNAAFTRVTGYLAEDVVGRNPRLLQSGRQDAAFYARLWEALRVSGHWEGEIWNRRRSGETYPEWLSITVLRDPGGAITNYVGIFSDITQRKQSEDHIRRLAHYDLLTGIPNRHLFQDRLQQVIARADSEHRCAALLYVDLDDFKPVNDRYGHGAGDSLLREAALRLQRCARDGDVVARLGGDEFAVVLEGFHDAAEAGAVAHRVAAEINAVLAEPFRVAGATLRISASIGIGLYPCDGLTHDALMHHADMAMYRAKDGGKGGHRFSSRQRGIESA